MSIPIPDQPRVSLLTKKEWTRRWRARGDSRMDLALAAGTSRSGEGPARAIVEEYAWGALTWEVLGMRTDTRPGHYVIAAPGAPAEVAHARARDLVAPRLTHLGNTRLPAPVPTGAVTSVGSSGFVSLLALTQVTWGPAVEGALVGIAAAGVAATWASRRMSRKRQTRVRRFDAYAFDPYDLIGVGARATADPHLDVLLTETLREIADDVDHVTVDVTAARLAKMRAALPPEVVPETVLAAREREAAAALVAAQKAATRREYVDARVDAVADLVAQNTR